MKWYALLGLALAPGVFAFSGGLVFSGGAEVTDEMRGAFIENFEPSQMNTTPGDAMMLRILVEASGAKRGVEVGASTGYNAINMGVAFKRTGGHLYTLEIDSERMQECRVNLKKAGLEDVVTCIEGDALKTLGALEGGIDFLFLNALKQDYLKYLKLVEDKLTPGAVVVADNVVKSARSMGDYLEYVQTSPDYDTVIILASEEREDGMAISYKIR